MSNETLIEKTDEAISELVHNKTELQKAYNYYSGIRDAELFRYLKENFGIGTPTSVEFTPLIKKHIDALVGEFLGMPILPKVSCKDSETISNINRDKQLYIMLLVYTFLQKKLKNSLLQFIDLKQMTDTNVEQELQKIIDEIDSSYVSEYEKAALYVVLYIMLSRQTDMTTNLRFLLLDLLIAGYCVFRCRLSIGNNNVKIEVLDPRNVFIDRNPESVYIKDSYRIVVRKWLNRQLILNMYGKDMKQNDIASIKNEWKDHVRNYNSNYIMALPGDRFPSNYLGLDYGIEVGFESPYHENYTWYNNEVLPVYEVEWLEVDNDFKMQRYTTVRIGEDIYILNGKDETAVRTKDNPTYCGLSVNGIYFTNRTPKPYSLMLACMHLQDKYDMLLFIRDTIIANSGTVGDYVDMSMLPTWLGLGPAERLQKYIAYKKNGVAPIDTAQEGRLATGLAPINTIFNGYDDTVKTQAIQAIQMAIDSIEQTASSITGVFRERLQGIEQRDAVTNIKQGVQNSFIVTKQYYQLMDLVVAEILLDALNVAKKVYKNGLTGTLILGDKYLKIFTALPEYFTLTDYDIHVGNSTDIVKDLEQLKALIPELVKAGVVGPDVIIDILDSKSLTEAKQKAFIAVKKLKEENNQLLLLLLLSQQLQQQLQQAQLLLLQAQQKVELLNELKLQLESQKILADAKVAWYEALTDRQYKTKQNEIDLKRLDIELALLHDGNPYNDEIRQN